MAVGFHRLAIQELVRARRWYAHRALSTESRFVAEVQAAIARIDADPYIGTPTHGTYYWIRTRRYPYILYYEIIRADLIHVYAIAHAHRRPGYWLRRVRRP
jgi:plasmid stabilization system protein ParE